MSEFSEIGGKVYDLRKDDDFEIIQDALGEEIGLSFSGSPRILEIGIGSGETTKRIFKKLPKCNVIGIDLSEEMTLLAKEKHSKLIASGQLEIIVADALEYLKKCKESSFDGVISALTFHNFTHEYRQQVLIEVYRVLKKGGKFANLDLFALDDPKKHEKALQQLKVHYVAAYTSKGRMDLVEWWMRHIDEDNAPEKIMLTEKTKDQMRKLGFAEVKETFRDLTRAVIVAKK